MYRNKLPLLLLLALGAGAAPLEMAQYGKPPAGFKEGFKALQDGQSIVELVPKAETVENWTQMVTLQGFQNVKLGVAAFRSNMSNGWLKSCPEGGAIAIREGEENGYPYGLWQLTCPNNPQTGKPENTWVKAIQGEQGLYVKQYAFRYSPSKEELTAAIVQLRDFAVCDNSAAHPCNGGKKKKKK